MAISLLNPSAHEPTAASQPGNWFFEEHEMPPASAIGLRQPFVAFTLLELLTSISIISILGALLFVAIAAGQRRVRFTTCANNLRQLGMSCRMYADDNRELLPEQAIWTGDHLIHGSWPWDIPSQTCSNLLHYGCHRLTLSCPTMPELRTDQAWNYAAEYRVIGYCIASRGCAGVSSTNTYYSFAHLSPVISDTHTGPPTLAAWTSSPSDAVIVSDPVLSEGNNSGHRERNRYASIPGGFFIHGQRVTHKAAHLDSSVPRRCNELFADGHLSLKRFSDTLPRSTRQPTFWW